MLVMMKHPVHGRLPVYSVGEVEANKLAGWVVEENAPEMKAAAATETAPTPSAPEPETPAKPKKKSFLAGLADEDEV